MKTIIIPTDFSKNGAGAYNYALNFIGNEEANFHVVNVVVPATQSIEYPSTASVANHALLEAAKNNLDKFEKEHRNDDLDTKKIKISTNVILGRIANSIINEGERLNADLIIMGTSGKGQSNLQKFLGSASSEVISNASIPVLLIPLGYNFKPIDNIIFATDLDKSDAFHIWKLSSLIKPNTVVVRCLHVISKDHKQDDDKISEFSRFLEENSNNIQTHFHIENSDDIEETIREFADRYNAEMIVMHRSSKSFWNRLFGKRHTKRMAYHLDVPLLIL